MAALAVGMSPRLKASSPSFPSSCRRRTWPPAERGTHVHRERAPARSERAELFLSADEGGLGQRPAPIAGAGHEPGLGHASVELGRDLVQVGEGGRRRLIAVARILPEQALDDIVQDRRHVAAEATELRRRRGEMQAQQLANTIGLEQRPPGQTFEEQHARGVEIRARIDATLERARLLGRHVPERPGRQASRHEVEIRAPREAEVDQERARERASIIDDDVGGLYVPVQDAVFVHVLQRGENVAADGERIGHHQRTGLKTLGERETVHEGRDEIDRRWLRANRSSARLADVA